MKIEKMKIYHSIQDAVKCMKGLNNSYIFINEYLLSDENYQILHYESIIGNNKLIAVNRFNMKEKHNEYIESKVIKKQNDFLKGMIEVKKHINKRLYKEYIVLINPKEQLLSKYFVNYLQLHGIRIKASDIVLNDMMYYINEEALYNEMFYYDDAVIDGSKEFLFKNDQRKCYVIGGKNNGN